MMPEGFTEFFLASAGTGGAFVGLLFVAISIGPQRTFGDLAGMGAPRQHLAEATFLTLLNGFVVSSLALIPGITVGWVAFVLGIAGILLALHLSWLFARFHRHGAARYPLWKDLVRVVSLSLIATVVFAIESLVGLRLILRPTDVDAYRWLAAIIIGLYALGMLRAWTLLGDPQHGWSGWLNPLQDLPARSELDEPGASPS
jgi:Na+/H+-translocating membrane pyrophosphatase